MSDLTDYTEQQLLIAMFQNGTFTGPEDVEIALYTDGPYDDGSGTEVSGTDYARLEVTANSTNFSGPTTEGTDPGNGYYVENGVDFDFGTVGAGGWGQIVGFAALDGSDNMLMRGTLAQAETANEGNDVKFEAGDLRFVLR